jgi:hypothetical protein
MFMTQVGPPADVDPQFNFKVLHSIYPVLRTCCVRDSPAQTTARRRHPGCFGCGLPCMLHGDPGEINGEIEDTAFIRRRRALYAGLYRGEGEALRIRYCACWPPNFPGSVGLSSPLPPSASTRLLRLESASFCDLPTIILLPSPFQQLFLPAVALLPLPYHAAIMPTTANPLE